MFICVFNPLVVLVVSLINVIFGVCYVVL